MSTENNDLASLLETLSRGARYSVFIPSLAKEVSFKQLTTEQLKRLLKTIVDSPIYNSEFIKTFNKIISENIDSENITAGDLTILDKLLIFVKTRTECISDTFTFNFTEDELLENKLSEKTKTISLIDLYNSYKPTHLAPSKLECGDYTVYCSLPTITTENKLEEELHKNIKYDVESPEELREVVGDTFINEITKYITSITTGDLGINLLNLSFKERIKIVEKLPTKALTGVLKYIESYRESIKPLTNVKITDTFSKEIPLDASFFNI